jgi:hypothetical protein
MDIISFEDRKSTFIRVAASKDLWYDIDANIVLNDVTLRDILIRAEIDKLRISSRPDIFPITGDVSKATDIWIPLFSRPQPLETIKILITCGSADNWDDRDITYGITNILITQQLISGQSVEFTMINPSEYIRDISRADEPHLVNGRKYPWIERSNYVLGELGNKNTPDVLRDKGPFHAILFEFCPIKIGRGAVTENFTKQQFKNLTTEGGLFVLYPSPRLTNSNDILGHLPKIIVDMSVLVSEHRLMAYSHGINTSKRFSIYRKSQTNDL